MTTGGHFALTCERFNITATGRGDINTQGGVLDLNMAGRGPGTMPDGEGVQKTIQEKVESYFPEHATEAPVAAAPDGANPPPGITDLVGKVKTQFSEDGTSSIIPATDNAKALPGITNSLGDKVNALITQSPSLETDIAILARKKWKIVYGPNDEGSSADRRNKVITLDGTLDGHEKMVVQVLAHEVGHALYPCQADYSSEDNYVNGALADEGEATLYNIRVQREILVSSGQDIGISGATNEEEIKFYNKIYDTLAAGSITVENARNGIGEDYRHKIASTTRKTYDETYRAWYKEVYVPWLKASARKGVPNGYN